MLPYSEMLPNLEDLTEGRAVTVMSFPKWSLTLYRCFETGLINRGFIYAKSLTNSFHFVLCFSGLLFLIAILLSSTSMALTAPLKLDKERFSLAQFALWT